MVCAALVLYILSQSDNIFLNCAYDVLIEMCRHKMNLIRNRSHFGDVAQCGSSFPVRGEIGLLCFEAKGLSWVKGPTA